MADSSHPYLQTHKNPSDGFPFILSNHHADIEEIYNQLGDDNQQHFFADALVHVTDDAYLRRVFTLGDSSAVQNIIKALSTSIITDNLAANVASLIKGAEVDPDATELLAWLMDNQASRAIHYPPTLCTAIAELASAIPRTPISGLINLTTHWPMRSINPAWPNTIFVDIYQLSGVPSKLENFLIISEINNNTNVALFSAMFTPYTSSNDKPIASIFADNPTMLIYILGSTNEDMARGVAKEYGSALYTDTMRRRLPSESRFLSIADFNEGDAEMIMETVEFCGGFGSAANAEAVKQYVRSMRV